MGDHAAGAIFDSLLGIVKIATAVLSKSVERTVAKQTAKVLNVRGFVAGEVFTVLVLKKVIASHIIAPFRIAFPHSYWYNEEKGGVSVKVLIDADGCPVVDITVAVCRQMGISCLLLCDTAHEMFREDAQTLVFDKGADSVDFALVQRVDAGDIVITQDYGLASMCLAKKAIVLHQDGWKYTEDNIGALLFSRHENRKLRASGGRVKGPKKRQNSQNQEFKKSLKNELQNRFQG